MKNQKMGKSGGFLNKMTQKKNKKFGRSGGFKKKQKRLVNDLVEKYPSSIEGTINIDDDNRMECDEIQNGGQNNIDIATLLEDNSKNKDVVRDADEDIIDVNIAAEEKPKSCDFPFDEKKFQSALARWAVNNEIKHDQLRALLKIWNEYVPLPPLPIDPRTLLATPRNVVIKNNYWHRGLQNALHKMLETNHSNVPDYLSLKINTDGITILKSSGVECWPILVEIAELPKVAPEIIGIYCGKGKPKDMESYLREFVDELNDFIANGFIMKERKFNIKVRCFIADSPARALLKSMLYES